MFEHKTTKMLGDILEKPVGYFKFYNLHWGVYNKHPNFFHRLMAKLFFGINYEKRKSND